MLGVLWPVVHITQHPEPMCPAGDPTSPSSRLGDVCPLQNNWFFIWFTGLILLVLFIFILDWLLFHRIVFWLDFTTIFTHRFFWCQPVGWPVQLVNRQPPSMLYIEIILGLCMATSLKMAHFATFSTCFCKCHVACVPGNTLISTYCTVVVFYMVLSFVLLLMAWLWLGLVPGHDVSRDSQFLWCCSPSILTVEWPGMKGCSQQLSKD